MIFYMKFDMKGNSLVLNLLHWKKTYTHGTTRTKLAVLMEVEIQVTFTRKCALYSKQVVFFILFNQFVLSSMDVHV